MNEKTIGFIGAGNMANAIIAGLLKNKITPPESIFSFDVSQEKLQKISALGVTACKSSAEVVKNSKYTVLAVKPQNYEQAISELKSEATEEKVFVTIAAGISIAFVNNALGVNCPVVRVMPNTPVLLGKGASAICASANIGGEDFNFVKSMFELGGVVEQLPESLMNTVIAVNGSSPAYIYMFAKAMVDYAEENGIPADKALRLVCAALEGSAAMLRESGDDPDTLIKKVCSPGGTTIEAVNTLNEYSFCEAIKKAMDSCTRRAQELGR